MSMALSTHGQVSSVTALFAARHILTKRTIQYVLDENRRVLRKSYSTVVRFCEERNIRFVKANAGLFVFAKLCTGDEKRFTEVMFHEGVYLSGGLSYHLKDSGWFRICFSIPPTELEDCLIRIDRAIGRSSVNGVQDNSRRCSDAIYSLRKRKGIEQESIGPVPPKRTKLN
jgi:gliotoxin/aspirochlorine biosynthesis aminotransferase